MKQNDRANETTEWNMQRWRWAYTKTALLRLRAPAAYRLDSELRYMFLLPRTAGSKSPQTHRGKIEDGNEYDRRR